MKKLLIMLLCCLVLAGCGNQGVSQEEYDKVVAERDELKISYDKLGKTIELKTKVAEYSAKVNAGYEHAIFVITVLEKASGADGTETKKSLEETYSNTAKIIENVESLFETADSLAGMSEDTLETTINSLDEIYNAWENAYSKILELESLVANSEGVSTSNSEAQNNETVIYQDESVIITYKGLSERKYGNGYEINFEVENLTEKTLLVQLRDTSINGIMVDPMYSVDIAPNKKSVEGASITGDDAENFPMSSVTNIETKFSITDDNNWRDNYETNDIVVLNVE